MRILYGVQATGNGHISRARAMQNAFSKYDNVEVDFVFSGRQREQLFEMEPFGDFRCVRGLTFASRRGRIHLRRSFFENSLTELIQDIRATDLDPYDLVITDFDPVTAWAAKLAGKESIGLGHQYAFRYQIPKVDHSPLSRFIMRYFAPARIGLGFHWHHFNQPILPPIAWYGNAPASNPINPQKILVYLGFEEPEEVIDLLTPFQAYQFHYYGPFSKEETRDNISLHPLSIVNFKNDLNDCAGVISNAGFELMAEALQLGRKILVKPLIGQMEQRSNAAALTQLGLGRSMLSLDPTVIRDWLENWPSRQIIYPDVAQAIADWILNTNRKDPQSLIKNLWKSTIGFDRTSHV